MNTQLLTVSPSPHEKGNWSVKKVMYGVVIAMLPALAASIWMFGINALIITLVSIASCLIFEYLIQKFLLKTPSTINDGSAIITGILLAFNLPSNLPLGLVIIGALVAIGIGKMSFGGLGKNPFNPALVGRVFLLISFPVDMTLWPTPKPYGAEVITDAITGPTPLAIVKEGISKGEIVPDLMNKIPSYNDLFIGHLGGSLGEISAIALLLGLGYMLIKKIITWHIPISFILTSIIFTGILHIINPNLFIDPIFHVLTGGLLLGAIFMATDMVTSPMSNIGMLVFGVGCGVLTVIIRVWGAYPEGVSFAILIMNAFVPIINNSFKPRRFGIKNNTNS